MHRRCVVLGVFCLLVIAPFLRAQAPTGSIEGRVLNAATGEYVENARVTVDGSALETLTDALGQYRLNHVPAGTVRVKAFRTGTAAQTHEVAVGAGATARQDFTLSELAPRAGDTVNLEQFVVGASREMENAAIAINTQRFAPNFLNVIAADEFGPVASGNVGEVLKTAPGVAIGLGGLGAPFTVSLNGVPPNNVPLTIGGFNLANAANATSRIVGLHQISINNMSRIEVVYTPTPESQGAALAGSVNLVPRSAFERTRPVYNYSAALVMRNTGRSFSHSPGSQREPTRTIFPSIDLAAIVPVNERFGFTVAASSFETYIAHTFSQNGWRGTALATNGGTLPDTTPDRPYLTDYAVRDAAALQERATFSTTLDYRFTPRDRVSLSFQYGKYFDRSANWMLSFFANRVAPGNFSTTFTHGFAGAGEIRMTNNAFKWTDTLWMPSLTYRHDGPIWKAEAAAGMSRSRRNRSDIANGYFNNVQARRQNVTVSYDDIYYLRPRVFTVTDGTTGARLDPFSIANYSLNTANSDTLNAWDLQRNFFANARRDFATTVPLTVKVGVDIREARKDQRSDTPTYTFVGADGRAGTPDDGASVAFDPSRSLRPMPYDFPLLQRVSNDALYDVFRDRPNYFQGNEATRFTRNVQQSKFSDEVVSAAYVRTDTQYLQGRLKVIAGLRAEQTNAKGEGQLIDPTRNYQRDAAGRIVRVNNQPALLTTDPLRAAQLTNLDRGLHAEKEYLRWFPSVNASYNLRENLIARAGYYWSIGRPDFAQYSGSLTLPDTANAPGPNNRIQINNVDVKAWSARTAKVSLEYYFEKVGLVSLSGFTREIKNFFGAAVLPATPDFLETYHLDPGIYGSYEVATQTNLSTPVRMSGLDVNYKQALTFLPHWARGVQVFANASTLRATGDDSANFAGYIPRSGNWGVSLARDKYAVRLRWNYSGRQRRGPVAAGRSIEPGTFNWGSKRMLFDVSGEYALHKHVTLFANVANVTDAAADAEIAGPGTPAEAQFRQRQTFGASWTIGLKGSF